jgi:hypothetical protein
MADDQPTISERGVLTLSEQAWAEAHRRVLVIAPLAARSVVGDFLKKGFDPESSVDNSHRNVCNRGRFAPIGRDGASPHVHDPATHRQCLRRPVRPIR